jgi:hypothetical protein
MLTITDTCRIFAVTHEEALRLELKLNKTSMGHKWSYIGDILFDYASMTNDAKQQLTVTMEQFALLESLQVEK